MTDGSRRLRFGVVGTGHWALTAHAAGLRKHPDVDLVGIWGRSAAATSTAAAMLGIRAHTSLDDLLTDVDAVALAVPPDVQAELAVLAAARGCHLLLDKPLAFDVAAGEGVVRAVADAGVTATVFFTNLYEPAVAAWVDQQSDRAWVAGRIRIFSSIFGPGSPYAGSRWRQERGALWDLGPHALAVATRVLGPVESVAARRGIDTAVDVVARHASGATSSISLSLTAPSAACGSEWLFYGPQGALHAPVGTSTPGHAYARCVSDLTNAALTGAPTACGAGFGLDVVRALVAAETAAYAPGSGALTPT